MAILDETFRHQLLHQPDEQYHAIIRTDQDASLLARECELGGMVVHRLFRLVPGLALTATGEALLALARNPHVTHIEPDREVRV